MRDRSPHQLWGVEAVVLSKITAPSAAFLIPFNPQWKHLTGLRLADRDFSNPGLVDVLLDADVFSRILLHGWRNGHSGTSLALEMASSGSYLVKLTPNSTTTSGFLFLVCVNDSGIPTSC